MNVLITGARQGLGACLTKAFLAKGHRVFALTMPGRGPGELEAVAGEKALTILEADLTRPEEIAAVHTAVGKLTTQLDIILNVAGVLLGKERLITENSYHELETTFRVNTLAPIYINNLFLDLARNSVCPTFLTICSEIRTIDDVGDWFPAYCISKTATTQYCFSLKATLKKLGMDARVFAVHPGRMRTAMGGDNSEIGPEESAAGILRLATGEVLPQNEALYVDYLGRPMLKS